MTVGVTIDTEEVHFGFLDNWDTSIIPSAAEAPITPVLHTLSHTHTLNTCICMSGATNTGNLCFWMATVSQNSPLATRLANPPNLIAFHCFPLQTHNEPETTQEDQQGLILPQYGTTPLTIIPFGAPGWIQCTTAIVKELGFMLRFCSMKSGEGTGSCCILKELQREEEDVKWFMNEKRDLAPPWNENFIRYMLNAPIQNIFIHLGTFTQLLEEFKMNMEIYACSLMLLQILWRRFQRLEH